MCLKNSFFLGAWDQSQRCALPGEMWLHKSCPDVTHCLTLPVYLCPGPCHCERPTGGISFSNDIINTSHNYYNPKYVVRHIQNRVQWVHVLVFFSINYCLAIVLLYLWIYIYIHKYIYIKQKINRVMCHSSSEKMNFVITKTFFTYSNEKPSILQGKNKCVNQFLVTRVLINSNNLQDDEYLTKNI